MYVCRTQLLSHRKNYSFYASSPLGENNFELNCQTFLPLLHLRVQKICTCTTFTHVSCSFSTLITHRTCKQRFLSPSTPQYLLLPTLDLYDICLELLVAFVGEALELGLVLHGLRHVGYDHAVRRGLAGELLVEVGHVRGGGGRGGLEFSLVLLRHDAFEIVHGQKATLFELVRA